MSYALFDDAGKFLAGRVMNHTDTSTQVELDSGRRVKVKGSHVLLRFDAPEPAELVARARALADGLDLELAWEFAPESDFGFAELAREYFDARADAVHQAAMLFGLFDAPHYFRRIGKGVFRKAGRETVQAALAAIERKRQQALQVTAWAEQLIAGECAAPIREQLYRILFKPDKNAPEYKAVVDAARRSQRAPLELLRLAGAIESPYQFHLRRFLYEYFPHGTGFAESAAPPWKDELPLAAAQAFSIDDSSTTEIDDALSVRGLGQGSVTLGIHIAAPALAIAPDSALDRMARERMSTVYMPGHKITMLPDAVVQRFTLTAGRDTPALSLYVQIAESDLTLQGFETRIERVHVLDNLRHDLLDSHVSEASLAGEAKADYPHAAELAFLFRLARELKVRREQVRGKPEIFNRPDYNFRVEHTRPDGPRGDEPVRITPRLRGAPLDLIVAEAMILANSHWGGWLAEHNVPAIYRQASLAPGVKVRMGTKPSPHAGMGVSQYSWATSPLRRYVDLVNQWQIVACARHGRTAALAAPFKPRDATLFSIISSFDATYAAYGDFQQTLERYWTLCSLQQQGVRELDAATMRDGLVRADALPLVFKVAGCEPLPRGTRVRVALKALDPLTLEVHATLLARLAEEAEPPPAADEDDATAPLGLQLAIDVDEADAPAEADAAPRRDTILTVRTMQKLNTLHWALIVSLGSHGGLLAFRIADPTRFERAFRDTPLEVILVNARSLEKPTKAQAIAQANLAGGGEAEKGRATTPLPASATIELGDSPQEARRKVEQLQEQQHQLLAQVRRQVALLPPPDPKRESGTPQDREQEERRRQLLKLLAEIEKRINDENARPKKRYISPATREEVYAVYYDQLRRRIEERGTRDFPEYQGKKLYGELTMNVTVDAAGRVVEADIVYPSKSRFLDRRAIAIVHAASPFGPFTQAMRAQADQIVVTSRFRFTREEGLETTPLSAVPQQ